MKKAIALVAIWLVACSSLALATEVISDYTILERGVPERVNRDGACLVSAWPDSGNSIGIWGGATWTLGSAHAMYIDPSMDEYQTSNCTPPFYPFHIASLEFDFLELTDDTNNVGHTFTYEITISCPKDQASGTVTPDCQGPGAPITTFTLSYTLQRSDYDEAGIGGWIILTPEVDVCVNGPFFLTARFTGWDGFGDAPQIPWHYHSAGIVNPAERCDTWLSLPAVGYSCYLLSGYDIGYGCATPPPGFSACFPGPVLMFAQGHAGMACPPVTCAPLPNVHGDDASDPIVVNTSPWTHVVDLCNFTSDYNYYDDAGAAPTTQRRFTSRGNDAVLQIEFDPNLPEANFGITLTPMCTPPDILRLRTWLYDATYGYTLTWGNPQYPAANAAQTYAVSDFPSRYLLFIDGYPCCCPVAVTYTGDTPLPVDLMSFTAASGNGLVNLSWTTGQESAIERWEIARNGEPLAVVNGKGDNATGWTYNYADHAVINGLTYTYTLTAYNVDGSVIAFPRTASATPQAGLVTDYALHQNFPNPFNPSTAISYAVKDAGLVTLKVYSVDGREIATLVNDVQGAGAYTVGFNGSNLASGVYLYKLEVNGFTATHKMVLMK